MSLDCSSAQRKCDNDNHTFVFANGVGKGLGRIKNTRWSWRKLKRKLAEPLVDNSVTYAQYEALDQDGRLEKKRAPGSWTPSRYKSNRRAIADLREKTLIVYDLDHVTHDQLYWIRQGLAPISRVEWFMHTSRSHTPEEPRARLVIPVSRPMSPDEGHAVYRLLAQELADEPTDGIEIPDLVSFRGNQTMFWPSQSRGQEFWTDENVAPILDVDEFLEANPGWADFQNLPYQAEESNRGITDPNKRMEDPYLKQEPIGAFCRAYTVQEVIENWLEDVYAPGDSSPSEERYTYLLGTGSNGAVVYEKGKFLHSNHGSDSVDTCNAFDLLRHHMFGHLDSEARADTSPGNLPSYKAMVKFAQKDDRVLRDLYSGHDDVMDDLEDTGESVSQEREKDNTHKPTKTTKTHTDDNDEDDLADLLGDLPEDEDESREKDDSDHAWRAHFRTKADGKTLEPVLNNVVLIVENDRRIKDCIAYNEFTYDPVCLKQIRCPKFDVPSKPVKKRDSQVGRRWEDNDDVSIQMICSTNRERRGYDCDMDRGKVESAVLARGMQRPIHPVKEYIQKNYKKWKEKKGNDDHLNSYVVDYLGCPDTPFHHVSGRILLIAAVARIYEPGCKFDIMPVIEGPTGSRKSTFWSALFGGFVTELKCDLEDTGRVIENLRGNWAVEMAEMAAAKKADSNTLKLQLSSARDTHRLAYAKRELEFPRQSIWTGTSNEDDYLTDPTSNRRFWVWRSPKTRLHPIDTDHMTKNIWKLWGAAYQAYLDMREAQPYGDLLLDFNPKTQQDVILEAIEIADGSRKQTITEVLAESIAEWLDTPVQGEDAFVDGDGMTKEGHEGDTSLYVRNMITPRTAFVTLKDRPEMSAYRTVDCRTYGKAMKMIPGWTELSKRRRHGSPQCVWFYREQDGPEWIPAPKDDDLEVDDLLS